MRAQQNKKLCAFGNKSFLACEYWMMAVSCTVNCRPGGHFVTHNKTNCGWGGANKNYLMCEKSPNAKCTK